MKNFNVVVGVLVGAVLGFAVRSQMSPSLAAQLPGAHGAAALAPAGPPSLPTPPPPGPARPPQGNQQVFRAAVGESPQKGPADAKVTIVEFSDFQCPFCNRGYDTIKQVESTYGRDVRVVFKHNPLPMHPDAPYAAKAAIAAQRQGKFWEMHDKLFEAMKARKPDGLKPESVLGMATEIGLDLGKFKQDVDSPQVARQIEVDQAQARQLGANGTPNFFINGVNLVGAQPFDNFRGAIDAAIKRADEKLAQGVSPAGLYDALIKDGATAPPAPPPQAPPPAQVRKVEVDDAAPSKGAKSAKVTIVIWSDFQCPFCSRVEPTLKQIQDTYGNDVRFVWRNQPLPFHPNAMPAAKAAMAAHRQGKFWQMHDLLFQNQAQLSEPKYEELAKQLGLDLGRWEKDKASPEVAQEIQRDMTSGSQLGADGTPTFFINGKLISGAMPFESFKPVIDEQIAKADQLLKKGTSPGRLYEELTAENVKAGGAAPAPQAAPAPGAGAPVKIEVGESPVLGPKNAPVTVVVWSDFQCPFCSRVEPTLKQLQEQYPGKLRFVWKNQPLPFHPNAMPAAEAAMAAGEQGKFWQMHDKLFENQQALGPELYTRLAQELGLDLNRFKSSLESGKFKSTIQADAAAGQAVGAGGTPTFFINGRQLVGAVPIDQFKTIIDAELAGQVAKK
jgi:protein-disulfide isomerase